MCDKILWIPRSIAPIVQSAWTRVLVLETDPSCLQPRRSLQGCFFIYRRVITKGQCVDSVFVFNQPLELESQTRSLVKNIGNRSTFHNWSGVCYCGEGDIPPPSCLLPFPLSIYFPMGKTGFSASILPCAGNMTSCKPDRSPRVIIKANAVVMEF